MITVSTALWIDAAYDEATFEQRQAAEDARAEWLTAIEADLDEPVNTFPTPFDLEWW